MINVLLIASFGGSYVEKRILKSINESIFRYISLFLILLIGIMLVGGRLI